MATRETRVSDALIGAVVGGVLAALVTTGSIVYTQGYDSSVRRDEAKAAAKQRNGATEAAELRELQMAALGMYDWENAVTAQRDLSSTQSAAVSASLHRDGMHARNTAFVAGQRFMDEKIVADWVTGNDKILNCMDDVHSEECTSALDKLSPLSAKLIVWIGQRLRALEST